MFLEKYYFMGNRLTEPTTCAYSRSMTTHQDILTVVQDHLYGYEESSPEGTYYSCKCGTDELIDPEDDQDLQEWHAVHLAVCLGDDLGIVTD